MIAAITSRYPYGSKEAFLHAEIAELARSFDVAVYPALADPRAPMRAIPGVRRCEARALVAADVMRDAVAEWLRSPARVWRTFLAVVRAPRALHARIKNALIFPKALSLARSARLARVSHVHAYWLSTPATIAFVISRLNGIPWSASGHRYDLVNFNIGSGAHPYAGFVSTASFVRLISQRGRALAERALETSPEPRIFTLHLGVVLPTRLAPIRRNGVLRIICAANLERVKGHETLLRALADCAGRGIAFECTLAGDGSERSRLYDLVARLDLCDRVRFVGVIPHDDLLERLRGGAFDLAVLTSIDEGPAQCEGIPIFAIECMAAGVPIVATRSGAIDEAIVDGCNGLLAPVGDAPAIARAIARLAHDERERARLRDAARLTVERAFDVTATARRVARAIEAA
ncbi:MAG: glycosyltransferase [bacterium]|nr:glycosyltransferase [bacterium]